MYCVCSLFHVLRINAALLIHLQLISDLCGIPKKKMGPRTPESNDIIFSHAQFLIHLWVTFVWVQFFQPESGMPPRIVSWDLKARIPILFYEQNFTIKEICGLLRIKNLSHIKRSCTPRPMEFLIILMHAWEVIIGFSTEKTSSLL